MRYTISTVLREHKYSNAMNFKSYMLLCMNKIMVVPPKQLVGKTLRIVDVKFDDGINQEFCEIEFEDVTDA